MVFLGDPGPLDEGTERALDLDFPSGRLDSEERPFVGTGRETANSDGGLVDGRLLDGSRQVGRPLPILRYPLLVPRDRGEDSRVDTAPKFGLTVADSTLVFAGELPDEELFEENLLHESKFAIMGCHAGDPTVGERELAPFRALAEPIADFSGTMPSIELQQLLDEDYPDGLRYYWKSLYLDDLSDSAIDRFAYWAETAPSPLSTVDIWQLGGAITEVGVDESAFAGRHAPFLLGVEANWEAPERDDANVQWVRDCLADMGQFSDGSVYLNFPGFLEDNDATVETTFGGTYERLQQLKDQYDPANLFSLNQNVRPSRAARSDDGN